MGWSVITSYTTEGFGVDDAINLMRDELDVLVCAGFNSRQEIVARICEDWEAWWIHEGRGMAELRALLEQMTDQLLEEHRTKQADWPTITDCDRLDAAFAELDANGILARQNYEQTLSSGVAAIWAEIEHEQTKRPIRGFVFFHEQDTETAVRCDGPVLAWGSVAEDAAAMKEVAEEIMAVLRRHGLQCSWTGQANSRICIDGMQWQRWRT